MRGQPRAENAKSQSTFPQKRSQTVWSLRATVAYSAGVTAPQAEPRGRLSTCPHNDIITPPKHSPPTLALSVHSGRPALYRAKATRKGGVAVINSGKGQRAPRNSTSAGKHEHSGAGRRHAGGGRWEALDPSRCCAGDTRERSDHRPAAWEGEIFIFPRGGGGPLLLLLPACLGSSTHPPWRRQNPALGGVKSTGGEGCSTWATITYTISIAGLRQEARIRNAEG